ncbi:MAG TPA: hypothetical protein DCE41_10455 [Cytophagales bacterium]|nr:hypothetical protein [Cytophagales bacterium]
MKRTIAILCITFLSLHYSNAQVLKEFKFSGASANQTWVGANIRTSPPAEYDSLGNLISPVRVPQSHYHLNGLNYTGEMALTLSNYASGSILAKTSLNFSHGDEAYGYPGGKITSIRESSYATGQPGNAKATLAFYVPNGSSLYPTTPAMFINSEGQVGIGTTYKDENQFSTGNFMLAVEGTIGAREVGITLSEEWIWPDYVFAPEYELPSLQEVKQYVEVNHHLEGIPSEAEVHEQGAKLLALNTELVKKVEELTLYLIQQNETITAQQEKLTALEEKLAALEQGLEE